MSDAVVATPMVGRRCTEAEPLRVAVLASGGGSNLQALLDARGQGPWQIVVVVVNVAGAGAIARAEAAAVPVVFVPHTGLPRGDHEARVLDVLAAHDVELVVLAGYMRVLTEAFVGRFARRIVNVHPALLPSFPGMHGARQALDHGCRVAGCTVHLVDAGVDTGPILAQAAVAILDDDDEAGLQRRIQVQEHRLLPAVVTAWSDGRVGERGGVIRCRGVVASDM
jgi:phosphoribosylglycinamide formyltransferase-1